MSFKQFIVFWDCLEHEREFASFIRAERFARKLVATEQASSGDVQICGIYPCTTVATIRSDGAGRIWTDLSDEGVDLLKPKP